jgi:hypothetical protein
VQARSAGRPSTARSVGARTQRCVQRMMHTDLQLRLIAPMIRTPSRPKPTCRISNSLNLGERRSPTWSNGRYSQARLSQHRPAGIRRVHGSANVRLTGPSASIIRDSVLRLLVLSRDPVSHLFRQSRSIPVSGSPH